MGVDYALGCNDCKEFVDCHKWPPHEEAGKVLHAHFYPEYGVPVSRYVVSFIEGCPIVRVDTPDLLRQIARPAPEHDYIQKLKERLPDFVRTHEQHRLFISCDLGPQLWGWDVPPEVWTMWKEIDGGQVFHTFQPRYLTEELNLTSWDAALAFLQAEHSWLLSEQTADEVAAIRLAFEALVAK